MELSVPEELTVLALVVFLLSLALRWSFGSETAKQRKLTKARDYGLLRQVATAPSEPAAQFVKDLLRSHGIRATTAPGPADGPAEVRRVLVFPADAANAADLLLRDFD